MLHFITARMQTNSIILCLFLPLLAVPSLARPQAPSGKPTVADAPPSPGAPSAADIAAAKAAGKVWVNLDTGVYHKSGRWYGKTKNGKFMTEAEAKTAGYKPAKKE
jgi:hypothetical protein